MNRLLCTRHRYVPKPWPFCAGRRATELGLDIEAEHDLAAVVQYALNRAHGKRNALTKLIADHFPPKLDAPEPFRVLARLPIRHVWTTNYDTLAPRRGGHREG
jgi:hypothetical protein